jgi:hypothetical protein
VQAGKAAGDSPCLLFFGQSQHSFRQLLVGPNIISGVLPQEFLHVFDLLLSFKLKFFLLHER